MVKSLIGSTVLFLELKTEFLINIRHFETEMFDNSLPICCSRLVEGNCIITFHENRSARLDVTALCIQADKTPSARVTTESRFAWSMDRYSTS